MKTVIKEVFIMCLLCVVIVLVLGILFYEYTPTQKALPVMIAYKPSQNIAEQIEEIDLASKNTAIIKSYSIGSGDLSMYRAQNLYVSGKKDPFAKVEQEENNTNTSTSTTQTNSSNVYSPNNSSNNTANGSNSSNNNTTPGDSSSSSSSSSSGGSSSTGTFFEKPGRK